MDAKILTENGWKVIATKYKVKDNGLQRALATCEKVDETKFDEQMKCLATVSQLAGALKKVKEVADNKDVSKYLADIVIAVAVEIGRVNNAKVQAEKDAAAQKAKEAAAKSKEDAKKPGEEEESGDYGARLLAAIQKVKSAKDATFEFIVCDAKPHCGVMIAKKITAQHKEELSKVTGGGKHFLPLGTCQFVDGKFDFVMEQPPQGLAKKLQDSIKNFTGKRFPIKAGNESAADEDSQPEAGAAPQQPQTGGKADEAKLEKASQMWEQMRQEVGSSIEQLKNAIRKAFGNDGQKVLAEVEQNMKHIDGILLHFDQQLSDSLARAHAAKDAAARSGEMSNAKKLLIQHLTYLKSEKMIGHLDENPFGVKTNLRQKLADTLKKVAEVVHV
jgi:hypothetical protein